MIGDRDRRGAVVEALRTGGFVAADDEADLLLAASTDDDSLEALLTRRLDGEPLAWLVGFAELGGQRIVVRPNVYVPRPHTEVLVHRALDALPLEGVAVDVCTGSGVVAAVLARARPGARVVATDVDPEAVACARDNGVEAYAGDLFEPVPQELVGRVDVVTGVVPYVPTPALPLLQRDTLRFEDARAYDGGADGLDLLRAVVGAAPSVLRPAGWVVLELGGDQFDVVAPELDGAGWRSIEALVDDEGDVRGVAAQAPGRPDHA